MPAALREYLRLLGRLWWQVFIGVCCGLLGAGKDMEAIHWAIPSWIWSGMAFAAFSVAQFLAFCTVHKELTAHRSKPKPNLRLSDVHDQVMWSLMEDDGFDDLAEPDFYD